MNVYSLEIKNINNENFLSILNNSISENMPIKDIKISSVNGIDINKLPSNLKRLDITQVNLNKESLKIFLKFVNLEMMIINRCYMDILDRNTLTNLKHLKDLNLNDNNIKIVPNSIQYLLNLERFSIKNNKLNQFPNVIEYSKKLKYLNLSDNLLLKIPNRIVELHNLEELD